MKIYEYNEMMSYLTRPARVGFKRGTNFTRNPSGINQWVMRTDAEIQAIIDNPKYEGWTKKDFRNAKILTKTETERAGLKFQHYGKKKDPTKVRKTQTKRTEWVKGISDVTTEQKLAGPKKSGLELSHLGSKTALATPNNLAYLPKYTNKLSYFRFEKILNDIQADQRRILADNKMTMDAKRKALAELAKADRTLRNRFKGLDYDKIKSRIKTKSFAWGIGEKEILKDPTIAIGKGETGANIALKTASKAEKAKVVAMGKDALNNFLKAEKEIKTLLNSADGPTIAAIRSVLKCGGLANGGNLLDCPMKKFAENPEAVLNKVGQAVPETRTPIMNSFKKLGMGTLKWGGKAFIGLTPIFAGMEIKEASEKFEEGVPAGQIVADVIGNWVLPGVGGGYKTYQKRKMMQELANPEELASFKKADQYKKYEMLQKDPLREVDYGKQLKKFELTDKDKLNLLNLEKSAKDLETFKMERLSADRTSRPLPEIDPFQAAEGGRVGFSNGGDTTSKLMSWVLNPENLERLKNNKGLVKQLTKIKALPSSVRLYLRNLAGVTDKITEDFFSKGELAEIKRRVAEAKANKSMGDAAISGLTTTGTGRDNIIGYQLDKGKLSLAKAFTDEATNIDMTLGQATFSTDDKGNIKIVDTHNFFPSQGGGTIYEDKEYFPQRKKFTSVVPHRDTHDEYNEKLQDPETPEEEKEWYKNWKKIMPDKAVSFTTPESDKQLLKRAKKALDEGDIDPSKYARIVAGLQQGEGIPIELNIGNITQKDKLEANPEFVNYLSTNPDIPTKIRTQAQEYLNVGGRVGLKEGSPKSPGRRAFLKGITALAALPIVGKYFKLGKVLEKAQPYAGPTIEKIKGMPEWFPNLVKKLWNEGEDVTKQVAYKERMVVKRGTLEGGDDVDMIYDMDTGDVSIDVTPAKNPRTGYSGSETTSGAYNKEYSLDYKKGELVEEGKYAGSRSADDFSVSELEPRQVSPEDVELDGTMTTVDDAFSDLTELEAFAKNKTTKQIHKKKGTKPKDVFPDWEPPDYDPY